LGYSGGNNQAEATMEPIVLSRRSHIEAQMWRTGGTIQRNRACDVGSGILGLSDFGFRRMLLCVVAGTDVDHGRFLRPHHGHGSQHPAVR